LNKKFGLKTVEGGFQKKLTKINQLLEDYFEVTELDFTDGENNKIKAPVVSVKNASEFALHILATRGHDINTTVAVAGVDVGGKEKSKFLKITLSLIPVGETQNESATSKFSGVNRTFVIAVAPVDEYHHNIQLLFKKTSIWGLKCFFCCRFQNEKYHVWTSKS